MYYPGQIVLCEEKRSLWLSNIAVEDRFLVATLSDDGEKVELKVVNSEDVSSITSEDGEMVYGDSYNEDLSSVVDIQDKKELLNMLK